MKRAGVQHAFASQRDEIYPFRCAIPIEVMEICSLIVESGFNVFLVGGSVRDIILHRTPHDFDFATTANFTDLKKIFPRGKQAGDKFNVFCIQHRNLLFEIATLRSFAASSLERRQIPQVPGTVEEDALQRDFTINAIYFDLQSQAVLDCVGGVEDLAAKVIKPIGLPTKRFEDDPLLMYRAIRFSASLGFSLPKAVEDSVREMSSQIKYVSMRRLIVEIGRQLTSGHAAECLARAFKSNLTYDIFPWLGEDLEMHLQQSFLPQALATLDNHFLKQSKLSTITAYAVFLWPQVNRYRRRALMRRPIDAFYAAPGSVFQNSLCTYFTDREKDALSKIWELQTVFENSNIVEALHPRFSNYISAAYNLFCIRCSVGELSEDLHSSWKMHIARVFNDSAER